MDGFRWGVIGLGLIGGSIARRLAQQGMPVLGADVDPEPCRQAAGSGIFEAVLDPVALAQAADGVILAAPVGAIEGLLEALPWRPGQVILDTGSTKRRIVAAMGRLPAGVGAVGGHPMAGKEVSGFAAADPGLFLGRPFILVPTARTTPEAARRAEELVRALGARPMWMEAESHDRRVAWISHLPYVTALALMAVGEAARDPVLWEMAASGFRDATRVAASDLRMMGEAVRSNADEVVAALDGLIATLERWRAHLRANPPLLPPEWEALSARRRSLRF
ncbi:MAG: prephenate dehydrogenase/arogenate dehydrogenase family protein [Thermoflexus sp.]|uniref:prephenate dehydrogenase n=1 Tax=Thermoflexus sp. TaxID=1969742 RepID=UPI00331B2347